MTVSPSAVVPQKRTGDLALLSIVIPIHNESGSLKELVNRVSEAAMSSADDCEIILVNDGSSDDTPLRAAVLAQDHRNVRVINLSRNFGKEVALTAGLDHATGDAVVFMDGDLQHPPEVIPAFAEKWRDGYDMVYGVRRSRDTESQTLQYLKRRFYGIFNAVASIDLPYGAGDFRLLDRKVVIALRQFRERVRFMKGLYSSVGFASCGIPYDVHERQSGRSSWNVWRLWNFAITGFTSHTSMPLRIWTYLGLVVALLAAGYGVFVIWRTIVFGVDVPGYATIVVLVLFFGSLNLISTGIFGGYIARIFEETKGRPMYIIDSKINFEK